ncbi:hypothetical protein [Isoptericola croceus]|uniref:hypothetical protein n=1 Tax=Isoptericola croceus TaxID=3031406 RepID=UPI0023F9205E|nr:hypothetical protein [Isoptericola croceus]
MSISTHDAAGTALFDESLHPRAGDGTFQVKATDESDGGTHALRYEPLDASSELMDIIHEVVGNISRREGWADDLRTGAPVDLEDAAGDVAEKCLAELAKGKTVSRAFVATVASSRLNPLRHRSGQDRQAGKMLAAARSAFEAEHGREATSTEIDDMADRIRRTWPEGTKRPSRTFHRETRVITVGDFTEHGQGFDPGRMSVNDDFTEAIERDATRVERADRLKDVAEAAAGQDADMTKIRRDAWNTLATTADAAVVRPHLSKHKVTAARKIMSSHPDGVTGAVAHAVDTYNRGIEDDYTAAMLAPFAGTDTDSRNAAVDLLDEHRSYAGDLWLSAIESSNTRWAS